MSERISPAELIRRSAAMARRLAQTARLHNAPVEAARFEQIAAEGEARAHRLDEIAQCRAQVDEDRESHVTGAHQATVHALERPKG